MDIQRLIEELDGSPDNSVARNTLAILERAGVFFRYASDGTLDMYSRLGRLEFDGKKYMVHREVGDWQNIKIWQIKVVPFN